MKKITLFLLLFSISILSFSQDSITVKVPDTAKLTVAKVYNDVKTGITGLAGALKVGAEHVYGVLVRQQLANSITNTIVMITLFLIGLIGINFARNTYKGHLKLCNFKEGDTGKYSLPDLDDSAKGVLSVLIGILSGITIIGAVIFTCCNINETIAGFINPEYGAIKDIINFVK